MLAVAWMAASTMLLAQPVNDNFANRISLSGTRIATSGTNVEATREEGEPDLSTGNSPPRLQTVWWSWTAPSDGLLAISTIGSDFSAVVDVFTGITLDELHLVSNCNFVYYGCGAVQIQVTAGTAYQIAVAGAFDGSGSIVLNLASFARPPNDDFAARIHLGSGNVSTTGTNTAATVEADEARYPLHEFGKSLWWSWTAPDNGPVTMGVEGSLFGPEASLFGQYPWGRVGLGIFTGDSLSGLVAVASGASQRVPGMPDRCQVAFEAVAGVTYQIGAVGSIDMFGALTLRVVRTGPPRLLLTRPLNDSEFLAGSPVVVAAEALDPDGTVNTVDFTFDEYAGIGSGTQRDLDRPFATTLTNLPPGQYDLYARATDNLGATADAIPIRFNVRPVNDAFASRISFTGAFVSVTGTLANASSEIEEPVDSGRANVWWSWTAPVSGTFTITAVSEPGYYPTLAVFSGASLSNLALVASSTFEGFGTSYSTRVVINTEAGSIHPISVGTGGSGGWHQLSVAKTVPPTVAILSPVAEARFLVGEPVTFAATAVDSDGNVRRVDYVLNDYQELGSATNSPFTLVHTFTDGPARHRIRARATDDAGIVTASELVWFEVNYPGPTNDHFADRVAFTGSFVSVTGTTAYATFEPDEAVRVSEGSAWWAWTAPESGDFTITAASVPGYWPALAVYTGSTLAGLNLITNNAYYGDDPSYSTRVVVHAESGVTYAIAVGSRNAITLSVARTVPPTVTITSPLPEARFLVGEPVTFTAVAADPDGSVRRVDFVLDDYSLLGSATNSPFTLVHAFTESYAWYRVRARATDDAGVVTSSESVWFSVQYPGPINDHFADRIAFTGSSVSITGSTANATYEPGESIHVLDGSAWWAWTAPESGDFTITASSPSGYWPSLAVFTGSTLASLDLIASSAYRGETPGYSTRVVVHAESGVTYAIAAGSRNDIILSVVRSVPPAVTVSGPGPDVRFRAGEPVAFTATAEDPDGSVVRVDYVLDDYQLLGSATNSPFALVHSFADGPARHRVRAWATDDAGLITPSALVWFTVDGLPPANDDFRNRTLLSGTLIITTVDARNATYEPDEPTQAPSPNAGSVWWAWTAPASGDVTLTLSEGNVFLAVFTGTNMASLVDVAATPSFAAQQLRFTAVAGTEYQIAFVGPPSFSQLGLFLDARGLHAPRILGSGLFAFDLTTTVERLWSIEASTNLVDWIPLEAERSSAGTMEFADPMAANQPRRFYRAVAEP